ncbi:tyrosine-protein phosphatase 99A-like [Amphibalanus amphitrite]|uniref:tyrosine-protein phosphatase 99A-like n=1 Tax=Amphibalanus amphitrite TaxID=1232801 RepID=UPI001C925203|nr:tyrosine-protein phosphatase 99A-like [Amphibalanus amphitrite]
MLKSFLLSLLAAALCGVLCSARGETKTVSAGANLTLTCPRQAEVSRPATVSWACRGCGHAQGEFTLARYGPDGALERREERARLLLPTFQLQIYPVVASDAGEYTCIVDGYDDGRSIQIVVDDVPPAPQRPLVVDFTSRSAVVSWAPRYSGSDTPPLSYVLQKRIFDPKGPWDQRRELHISAKATTYNVTGLRPFTAYSFRVFAVNRVGRSEPSDPSYPTVTHREHPSGKPTVIRTRSPSPTSIEVLWRPPDADTMNGEFIGHVLSYRPRDQTDAEWTLADLSGNANETTSYEIEGLTPYTEYLIRIRVKNLVGLGPFTVVRETTQEGVPGRPEDLKHLSVGDTWAMLAWSQPHHPNGIIEAYYLYFDRANRSFTDNRVVRGVRPQMSYNLTRLEPYTRYTVWLHAKTAKHEGARSARMSFVTDVGGPGAPEVTNASCQADTSVYLQWRRPAVVHGSIDMYRVMYRSERQTEYHNVTIDTSYSVEKEQLLLTNLSANTMFEVRVVGLARSRFDPNRVYVGEPSVPRQVLLQPDCERVQYLRRQQTQAAPGAGWELSTGMVAGVVCAVLALLLAVLALLVWRKYFQAPYNYLDAPQKAMSTISTDWESDSPDGPTGPIPVHLFPKHVDRLHADGDIGFSKEYEAIQAQTLLDGYTSDLSQQPENKHKNRYLNIVAYDHTMVPLHPSGSQKKADYVNANYVDGYQRPRAYIATQGPLPDTFDAFWRLVWEQNVYIVVMITNLMERGRKKCDQYWPQEGKETYGDIQVTAVGQNVMATYTIRKFCLRHLKVDKKRGRGAAERVVYQYHYTSWPDHGIPHSPLPILSFIRKSAAANPEAAGPIVVHCSAGVGRTGTYIVLDSMMRMIRAKGEVNVFGFLKHIRTQRNFLVQTEDQYVFLHDALLEVVESGETDIHSSFLRRYLHNLQTTEQDIYPWYNLDRQFKLINYDQPSNKCMSSGRHPLNVSKNRRPDLLPTELHRVRISPKSGVECSDYVNASWLPGFSKLDEFVVTQHPLTATVADFWQMVWEHNAQTIVLLSPVDDQEYCIFWPMEHVDVECDQFRARFVAETRSDPYVLRDFTLQSPTDEYELAVRIIQCSNWPENCSPIVRVFDLIQVVQRWHLEYQNGPCLVVDRFGGTEAATFCCLTTLMKQLEYESHADVYMYARLYQQRRPEVWRSQDDFLFLYRAVEALVASDAAADAAAAGASPPPPDVTDVQRQTLRPILKKGGARQRPASTATVRIPPDGMESVVVDMGEYVT